MPQYFTIKHMHRLIVGSYWAAEGQEGIAELVDVTRRLKGEQGKRRRRTRRRRRR
jgi:hypothetical protein